VIASCGCGASVAPDHSLDHQSEDGEEESESSESLKSILQRAAGGAADVAAGVRCCAVKVVVVLGLEDKGGQPEVAIDEIKRKCVPRDVLHEQSCEREEIESSGRSRNDFSIDDMFSFRVVFVDVGGCDAHDNDCAGPLHEPEEEEGWAEDRTANTELDCHCMRFVSLLCYYRK